MPEYDLPKVSIIVSAYKSIERITKCLESLIKNSYPHVEIIVVGVFDFDFPSWCKKKFSDVKAYQILSSGPTWLRNYGYKQIDEESKYIAFIDDDIIVLPDSIIRVIQAMEKDNTIGCAQPLQVSLFDKKTIDCVGGFIDPIGYVLKPDRIPHNWKIKNDNTMSIFFAQGCVFVKRSAIMNLGIEPYDNSFEFMFEDVDLSWRLRLIGFETKIILNSIVYHPGGTSRKQSKLRSWIVFENTKNRFTTLIKNYEIKNLLHYLPITTIFESAKAIFLINKNLSHFKNILKGILHVIKNLGPILQKRQHIQSNRKKPEKEIISLMAKPNLARLIFDFKRNY